MSEESSLELNELFKASYGRLARLLYRVTGDRSRAEEVASEAFWRLHQKPPKDKTNIEGWLYRTGIRLALDGLRMERRRTRYEALASVFRSGPSPQTAIEQSEESARVRNALQLLKPQQAALILLRADGLSYVQIAAALELNPGSVGTLLARAQRAFRKEYVNRYGQP
jgi:RNA polymerase sigma-70 factor (ECF subfamily)